MAHIGPDERDVEAPWKGDFRGCGFNLRFQSMRETEAQKLWQMIAMQLLSVVEKQWKAKHMGLILDFKDEKAHQICSLM